MDTKSRKGKGRTYQQYIRDRLIAITGLRLESQPMGQAGSDIIDIDKGLPWETSECKHWKEYPSLNHLTTLLVPEKRTQVFFMRANRKPDLVVMKLDTFLELLEGYYYA